MAGYLSTLVPSYRAQEILCSLILVSGNSDYRVPGMGCGNNTEVGFHLRSLARNKYPVARMKIVLVLHRSFDGIS